MTVAELIEILRSADQDAEVTVAHPYLADSMRVVSVELGGPDYNIPMIVAE